MRISEVRVIVTCPGRNYVLIKVMTDEPGLYGVGDATLNGRELAVATALEEHIGPLLIGRDPDRIEIGEQLAVADTLPEDRLPAQARLRSLEDEELEQGAIVVDGDTPLSVVVGDAKLGARPAAARGRAHLLVPLATFFFRGRRLP